MKDSKIAWTHHTFNPWTGCVKVSAGCVHCYAETLNLRWGKKNWGAEAERTRTSEAYWKQPITWNKEAGLAGERRRVFCASMADVGEDRDDLIEARRDLSIMIERTPHLDWLLLTKRPENMVRLFARWNGFGGWPENVWVGTSAEDQAAANKRIPILLSIPAKIRFVSAEPLIDKLSLVESGAICVRDTDGDGNCPIHFRGCPKVDWVIVGGESGPSARPMQTEWAWTIWKQCQRWKVAFFMKQMGGSRDKREDLESIPEDLRIRQYPGGKLEKAS